MVLKSHRLLFIWYPHHVSAVILNTLHSTALHQRCILHLLEYSDTPHWNTPVLPPTVTKLSAPMIHHAAGCYPWYMASSVKVLKPHMSHNICPYASSSRALSKKKCSLPLMPYESYLFIACIYICILLFQFLYLDHRTFQTGTFLKNWIQKTGIK